jgi:hypothetical protein
MEGGQAILGAEAAFHGDELSDSGCGELGAQVLAGPKNDTVDASCSYRVTLAMGVYNIYIYLCDTVQVGARSISHLEMLSDEGVKAMAAAGVHAVLLPTVRASEGNAARYMSPCLRVPCMASYTLSMPHTMVADRLPSKATRPPHTRPHRCRSTGGPSI